MEQGNNGYIGKKILVIFEDGAGGHVSKKEGVCTESNAGELILDYRHIIPKARIIRAEVIGG